MNKCKICKAPTVPFEHLQLNKSYHHCSQCDFIALDESYYVSIQAERKQYEQHNNSIENEGYVAMFERFIAFIHHHTGKAPLETLDFGSGPGPVLAQLLKEHGHQTSIYDPFFAPNHNVFTKQYDLITSTEVVEHMAQPLTDLSKLVACMKPNAFLALMTQFHPQDQKSFCSWWYPRDPTHISFFSTKTLKTLAEKLNLKLLHYDRKSQVIFQKLID